MVDTPENLPGRRIRVEIWSDLVCPWCYIGKRRFDKALARFAHRGGVTVIHRSFQLDPTIAQGQTFPHRDVLMRKYRMTEAQVVASQTRLEVLAAAEGLEYHLANSRTGNTLDAHRLVHLAGYQGIQEAVIERLFRAHFTENRSLFDEDSLTTLADEAGLEGARNLISSTRFADEVRSDHREATAFGASGVPFFVLERRYAVSGAQGQEAFAEVLARAWNLNPEP